MRTHRKWEAFEAVVGLLAAFFVGFTPPVILVFGILATLWQREWFWTALSSFGLLISTMSAVFVARAAQRAFDEFGHETELERRIGVPVREAVQQQFAPDDETDSHYGLLGSPVAVKVACSLAPGPALLRPLVSLWWLAHFVVGAIIGFGAAHFVTHILAPNLIMIAIPLAIVVQVAFIFAVNLYLLLCLSTFTRSPAHLEMLWRWRIVIDLAVTAALFLIIELQ